MSVPACIGEPISWLRLERYRLGELTADERGAVDAHVAACAACAACLNETAAPLSAGARAAAPALASVAASVSAPPFVPVPFRGRRLWARGSWPAGLARAAGVGVAAALALALMVRARLGDETTPARAPASPVSPTLAGVKGDGVAVELVSERGGIVGREGATFVAGDRWKVLVTCPAERLLFWDVAVIVRRGGAGVGDGAGPSFPLAPSAPIACGNHVPLPGAFRLDGAAPVEICVVLAGNPVDRRGLAAAAGRAHLDDAATCVTLRPSPSPSPSSAPAP